PRRSLPHVYLNSFVRPESPTGCILLDPLSFGIAGNNLSRESRRIPRVRRDPSPPVRVRPCQFVRALRRFVTTRHVWGFLLHRRSQADVYGKRESAPSGKNTRNVRGKWYRTRCLRPSAASGETRMWLYRSL